MGKLKRIFSAALTVAVIATGFVLPAQAAQSTEEHNQAVTTKVAQLEKKYYIDIEYQSYKTNGESKAGIDMAMLNTLDTALGYATPSVVQQVSRYWEQQSGRRINVQYIYSNMYKTGEVYIGSFAYKTSTIEFYMPPPNSPSVTAYADPLTIVHEFGHAFTMMCMDKYGYEKMMREFSAFNSGYSYNPANILKNPNQRVFVTGYAATMFEEDMAETFANALVRNRTGLGFTGQMSQDGALTSVGRKVRYVENLISKYVTDSAQILENYRKTYKTSGTLVYGDMKFSGLYLQYAGYPETRSMLMGALKYHGIDGIAKSATWIQELGAWSVAVQGYDDEIYLFPDYSFAYNGEIVVNEG